MNRRTAGRRFSIAHLRNLLDQEEIDPPTRFLVQEDLDRLRAVADVPEDKQLEIWRRIKARAPGLFAGGAWNVVQNLTSAYIRQRLGL